MHESKPRLSLQSLATVLSVLGILAWSSLIWQAGGGLASEAAAQFDQQQTSEPLSFYMGDMQRYSQKLGAAIAQQNKPLARFYTEEIQENIGFIKTEFKKYDQLPIGTQIQMLDPPALSVRKAVEGANWSQARQKYEQMVQVCNACHAAAQRPYVVIEPVDEAPAFNQRFKPKPE